MAMKELAVLIDSRRLWPERSGPKATFSRIVF